MLGGAAGRLLQCATTLILVFSGINWSQTIPLAMMQFVSACTLLAQWDKSGRDHMYVARGRVAGQSRRRVADERLRRASSRPGRAATPSPARATRM